MIYSVSLFLSTFLLEDVALASALTLIANAKIGWWEAFFVCVLGIAVGDLGLFILGKYATQIPYLGRILRSSTKFQKVISVSSQMAKGFPADVAIVVSRALPGTRLPTYLAAGFIGYPMIRFLLLTVLSVSAWVGIAFFLGHNLISAFQNQWVVISFFILFLLFFKRAVLWMKNPWEFQAALHSWRKALHFEFWPAWIFYLPLVPWYIYLSIRHRSLLSPFYASPGLQNGGLIGESKWDYLKFLDPEAKSTL
ncbi:hypothetical protein EBR03_10570, partial [bacterium]|nr:hypothetical protein [bacterium]